LFESRLANLLNCPQNFASGERDAEERGSAEAGAIDHGKPVGCGKEPNSTGQNNWSADQKAEVRTLARLMGLEQVASQI